MRKIKKPNIKCAHLLDEIVKNVLKKVVYSSPSSVMQISEDNMRAEVLNISCYLVVEKH